MLTKLHGIGCSTACANSEDCVAMQGVMVKLIFQLNFPLVIESSWNGFFAVLENAITM